MSEYFVPCVVMVLVEAPNPEDAKKKAREHIERDIMLDLDEIMEPEET